MISMTQDTIVRTKVITSKVPSIGAIEANIKLRWLEGFKDVAYISSYEGR